MKRDQLQTEDHQYTILAQGLYVSNDSALETVKPKPKKVFPLWIYVAARIAMMVLALVFFVWGSLLALDGSWNLATFIFVGGVLFFIPFILYSRKVNEIKKTRSLTGTE